MTYTFDVPIDMVFFLFFAGGFIAGFATLYMIMDYARMRAEHAEKYNCMGIRRHVTTRTTPPKPLHPKILPLPLPEKPKK